MKKIQTFWNAIFFLIFLFVTEFLTAGTISNKYTKQLEKIFQFQGKIKHIHPALKNLYPIVIAENDSFYLFDVDASNKNYQFIKSLTQPWPVPDGIRASFPLSFYENRPGCVVSGDVFDEESGYVTIFHEFIHCRQFATVEQELKNQLSVYREAMDRKDYMWELNHPFPYTDSLFVDTYSGFLEALSKKDRSKILRLRNKLKENLSIQNYEYLCWQEWKEGFARLTENKINEALNLSTNNFGAEKPFNRITFYAGGSAYIDFLIVNQPELFENWVSLFDAIKLREQ